MKRVYLCVPIAHARGDLELKFNNGITDVALKLTEVTRSDGDALYVFEGESAFRSRLGTPSIITPLGVKMFIERPTAGCPRTPFCRKKFPDHVIKHPRQYLNYSLTIEGHRLEIHFCPPDEV